MDMFRLSGRIALFLCDITGVNRMLHINQQPRYQMLFHDLQTVYATRGTPCSHYIAGMLMATQIARGISDIERINLNAIVEAARYAK